MLERSHRGPRRSVDATLIGMAPRVAVVYVAPPGAMPLRAHRLERLASQIMPSRGSPALDPNAIAQTLE
jgi:hypothetical protein